MSLNKWRTIADIPDSRTWAGHNFEYLLTTKGDRDWGLVEDRWPRLSREYGGAYLVIRDGHEVRAAYFFDGIIPDLDKSVYMARVQR